MNIEIQKTISKIKGACSPIHKVNGLNHVNCTGHFENLLIFEDYNIQSLTCRNCIIEKMNKTFNEKFKKLEVASYIHVEFHNVWDDFIFAMPKLKFLDLTHSSIPNIRKMEFAPAIISLNVSSCDLNGITLYLRKYESLKFFNASRSMATNFPKFPRYPAIIQLDFDGNPGLKFNEEAVVIFCNLKFFYDNLYHESMSESYIDHCSCLRVQKWFKLLEVKNNLKECKLKKGIRTCIFDKWDDDMMKRYEFCRTQNKELKPITKPPEDGDKPPEPKPVPSLKPESEPKPVPSLKPESEPKSELPSQVPPVRIPEFTPKQPKPKDKPKSEPQFSEKTKKLLFMLMSVLIVLMLTSICINIIYGLVKRLKRDHKANEAEEKEQEDEGGEEGREEAEEEKV